MKFGRCYLSTGKVSVIHSAQNSQERPFSVSEIATYRAKKLPPARKNPEMMSRRAMSHFPCFDVHPESSHPVRQMGFDEVVFLFRFENDVLEM
jgi:hypothetical protein